MYKKKVVIIALLIAICLIGCTVNSGGENDVPMEQNDTNRSNKEGVIATPFETSLDAIVSPVPNEITEAPGNQFTEEEIEGAIQSAYKHFDAMNKKDRELILESMHPDKVKKIEEHEKTSKVYLYDDATITPITIEYFGDNHNLTKSYTKLLSDTFEFENILVLFATIEVEYSKGITGSWTEGTFPNYALIMVRDDMKSPWLLYEKGF